MNDALPLVRLRQLRSQLPTLQPHVTADQTQLRQALQFFIDEIFSLPYGRFLNLDGPSLRQQFAYLDLLHQQVESGHLALHDPHSWQLIRQQMLQALNDVLAAEADQAKS